MEVAEKAESDKIMRREIPNLELEIQNQIEEIVKNEKTLTSYESCTKMGSSTKT